MTEHVTYRFFFGFTVGNPPDDILISENWVCDGCNQYNGSIFQVTFFWCFFSLLYYVLVVLCCAVCFCFLVYFIITFKLLSCLWRLSHIEVSSLQLGCLNAATPHYSTRSVFCAIHLRSYNICFN